MLVRGGGQGGGCGRFFGIANIPRSGAVGFHPGGVSVDLRLGGAEWVDEFVLTVTAQGAMDRWVSRQRAWVQGLLIFARVPVCVVRPPDVHG